MRKPLIVRLFLIPLMILFFAIGWSFMWIGENREARKNVQIKEDEMQIFVKVPEEHEVLQ